MPAPVIAAQLVRTLGPRFGRAAIKLLVEALKNEDQVKAELKTLATARDKEDLAKKLATLVRKRALTPQNMEKILKACTK